MTRRGMVRSSTSEFKGVFILYSENMQYTYFLSNFYSYVPSLFYTRGSLALLGFLSINKYVLYSFHIYYRTIYIIIIIVPTELNFNIIFEFSADFTCYLTYYKPIAKKS